MDQFYKQNSILIFLIKSEMLYAAMYIALDGRHGLAGWRWLRLIDGVVTILVAHISFVSLPVYTFAVANDVAMIILTVVVRALWAREGGKGSKMINSELLKYK